MTIPKTVTYAGDQWEGGALKGSLIETVIFEEGIPAIPGYICSHAEHVKKITLPENKDFEKGYNIGAYAFESTALTAVTIPDKVKSIEKSCFAGCKSLESLQFGSGITSIGGMILNGNEKVKTLTIPNSVTYAGDQWESSALKGSSIETLIIAPGMTTVPAYLAAYNTKLRTVYLPDSVTNISNYAFIGCENLEHIKSTREVFTFSSKSFEGCNKLDDPRFMILERENTYLVTNSEQADKNGIVNYTLRYQIAPSVAENASKIRIQLDIPQGLTLLQDSLQTKDLTITPDSNNSNMIYVEETSGELRFSVRVTEVGDFTVGAFLHFRYSNEDWKQQIGRVNVICPEITTAVPEHVNTFSAEVYGIAPKGQDVVVYVNDDAAATLTANAYTGKYKGTVTLPEGKEGTVYTIHAECGDLISETVKTTYFTEKPVVTNVVFRYNQHSQHSQVLDITDVFLRGTSPVISYNPAYPVSYEIKASNSARISRMFVTSTKASGEKYLEAFYDKETDTWIANGFFDPTNHSYVPGSMNISILEKDDVVLDDSYDYEEDQKFADMPQEFKGNSSVTILNQTKEAAIAEVNVSDGNISGTFQLFTKEDSNGMCINNTFVSADTIAKEPEKYGFIKSDVITDENGRTTCFYTRDVSGLDCASTIMLDFSEGFSIASEVWSGEAILKVIEGEELSEDPGVQLFNAFVTDAAGDVLEEMFESYGPIGDALSFGSDLFKYAAQLKMANGNEEYMSAASVLFALKCLNTFGTDAILTACGCPPPFSTVIKFGIDKALDVVDDYLTYCIQNNREFTLSGFVRFIIDPSGIVYEAVIGNPVEGAIVTVYFRNPETGETVKWNAEDYDQLNPLQTDEEGKYLWDVPEGQWKVICEKEGYDTVETDWMEIPPVRTDVNLSLVSKEAPILVSAELAEEGITVAFSKFVDITTVTPNTLTVTGCTGDYTITPVLLHEDDAYADTFLIGCDFDTTVTVGSTAKIYSYAGTPAESTELKVSAVTLGDLDNDGSINASDAAQILIAAAAIGAGDASGLTAAQETAADVNTDGSINASDAAIVLIYAAAIGAGQDVNLNDFVK